MTTGRIHNKGRANLVLSYASHGPAMIIAFITVDDDFAGAIIF